MVLVGIGIALAAFSKVRHPIDAEHIPLKGREPSGGDTLLSGVASDGSRLTLMGKIA